MYMMLSVTLGGTKGAVSRYWILGFVCRAVGGAFPWSTLTVNVLRCSIQGVLIQLMALVWSLSEHLRVFLTVGPLGALTTLSAFSLEAVLMLERGDRLIAVLFILLSAALCVGATMGTMALVKMVLL